MQEREYYLGFSLCPGIGISTFEKLLAAFKTAQKAWSAEQNNLEQVLGKKLTEQFVSFRNKFSFGLYQQQLEREKVSFVCLFESEYPNLLKQIVRPPFVLFIKGNFDFNSEHNKNTIGVVGSRKVTQYGKDVTELVVSELVDSGSIIVSGLALGVDGVAHQTTLDNKGKTIAVLGCGVSCCSPAENTNIYNGILENGGAIISELPLFHPPTKGSFPARNRIIAGLSQAVVVTEGAEDSGSLITAEYAFKFNRKVFAVPGPITSNLSKGPYKLISKGAKLVTSGQDIVQELGIKNHELRIKGNKKIKGDSKEENIILRLLENEAMGFDEIVRRSKLDSSTVAITLSMMEVKGMIKSQSSGNFLIAS